MLSHLGISDSAAGICNTESAVGPVNRRHLSYVSITRLQKQAAMMIFPACTSGSWCAKQLRCRASSNDSSVMSRTKPKS